MAEWLGSALQKLLQRFESASDLQPQKAPSNSLGFFCAQRLRPSLLESKAKGAEQQARLAVRLSFLGLRAAPVPASSPEGRQSINLLIATAGLLRLCQM